MRDEFLAALLAREQGGQEHTIVGMVSLRTEHDDLVGLRRQIEELFKGAHRGDAAANHHQAAFGRVLRAATGSMRTQTRSSTMRARYKRYRQFRFLEAAAAH